MISRKRRNKTEENRRKERKKDHLPRLQHQRLLRRLRLLLRTTPTIPTPTTASTTPRFSANSRGTSRLASSDRSALPLELERQLVQHLDGGGHHVVRELRRQKGVEALGTAASPMLSAAAASIVTNAKRRGREASRLDTTTHDAVTPGKDSAVFSTSPSSTRKPSDLHLRVLSPEDL